MEILDIVKHENLSFSVTVFLRKRKPSNKFNILTINMRKHSCEKACPTAITTTKAGENYLNLVLSPPFSINYTSTSS